MTYSQKQTLEKVKKNIAKPWRNTWLKAIEGMNHEDGKRLLYAAESGERMAKIERTVELWNAYRDKSGKRRIDLGRIKADDLLPLLDVHYYRRRLAQRDTPPGELWAAMNTVLRPAEADPGNFSKLDAKTTYGIEIECFDLDKVVGQKKGSDGKNVDITRADLIVPLLRRLIPDKDKRYKWQSVKEGGVMRQGVLGEGWEITTPILDTENIKYLNAALQLIKGMQPYVNSSSALHVHIGIDDGKPKKTKDPQQPSWQRWDFRELKRLGWQADFTPFQTIRPAKQFLINYMMLEKKLAFMDHRLVHSYEDIAKQSSMTVDDMARNVVKARNFEELLAASRPDVRKYKVDSPEWNKVARQRAKVNVVQALREHGTIEVRHHPGTVEPREIIAWTRFLDRLMKQSADMTWGVLQSPRKPSAREMASLEKLVDDFIRERGSTKIVDDAELPPERRAGTNGDHTNIKRPITTLSAEPVGGSRFHALLPDRVIAGQVLHDGRFAGAGRALGG